VTGVDEERELRQRLGVVEVPPSRLDVGALVREGQRRRRRRRSGQAAVGVAAAIAVLVTVPTLLVGSRDRSAPITNPLVTPAPSQVRPTISTAGPCSVRELPVPAGMKEVAPTGIDPTGRYVVGNGLVGQNYRPVLWTDGKARALPVVGQSVQLEAVNASGVVVGLVSDRTTSYVFRWENGKYTKLRTPPGRWNVYPVPRINTAGDVVINAEPLGNSGGEGGIVLLWKAGRTTATKLPLPTGAGISDINDNGMVIGSVYKDGEAVFGYAWDQQGHGVKLANLSGQTAAAYAARGDWVVGGFWPHQLPARWNLRTGAVKEYPTPPDADLAPADVGLGPANMVNAKGWVVAGGYVLRDDGPAKLPVSTGLRANAVAVSDDGVVVGTAQSVLGTVGPRVWHC
jgi:hypothetical protein